MKSNRNFYKENLAKNDMVAAPLAGISHLPFRRILRKYFDGIIYSEMMSVEGIARKNPESTEFLDRIDNESPLVFQLFGGKASAFVEAIKIAEDITNVEAFDINMGCPVKKVIKAGGGCSLLGDLPRMKDIVQAVRSATDKPFSVKTRIGLEHNSLVYKEVLKIVEGEGADALTIHARTKSDMFGGTVRLDILQEMASMANIALIGNGGVIDKASYDDMKATGVDGVMIARGMMKAPWIFESIRNNKSAIGYLQPIQIRELLLEMWGYMLEHANGVPQKQTHYMHILRKFAVWFCKGMEGAVDFRVSIYKTQTDEEVISIINNFYR